MKRGRGWAGGGSGRRLKEMGRKARGGWEGEQRECLGEGKGD